MFVLQNPLTKKQKTVIVKNSSFKDKTMGDLMEAEQRATIETFKLNNFSFREIYIPKIDEQNLGKLLSFSIYTLYFNERSQKSKQKNHKMQSVRKTGYF